MTAVTPVPSESVGSKLKRNIDLSRHSSTPPGPLSQIGSRLTKTNSSAIGRANMNSQSAAVPHRSQSFTRTDCGRYSMRNIKTNQTGVCIFILNFYPVVTKQYFMLSE